MRALFQDLRYGFHGFVRTPGFTVTAVLALGLGIGANSAIFSLVSPILFRPLPFAEPDELVSIVPYQERTGHEGNVAYPDFADWQEQAQSFDAMGTFAQMSVVMDTGDNPIRAKCMLVSSGIFRALAMPPRLGRTLTDTDDSVAADPVVVLGHQAWAQHFGARPNVIGQSVQIDGRAFSVVGVMPEEFRLPASGRAPALWLPLHAHSYSSKMLDSRGDHFLQSIARLKDGVSVEQAATEMKTIAARLEAEYPDPGHVQVGIKLVDLQKRATKEIRPVALILLFAVGLVLLIACANVANLLLVRANGRQQEIAIRLALGASRGRLIRQLLAESVLLSFIAAGCGLLMSLWMIDALKSLMGSRIEGAQLDGAVLAYTGLVASVTGILFGLVPAIGSSRLDIKNALHEAGARASLSRGRLRTQNMLIVSQIALAFALLSGAGLMIRSLMNLAEVDPGFNAQNLVAVRLPLPDWNYTLEEKRDFYRRLIGELDTLPGVQSASAGDPFPFHDGTSRTTVTVEGAPPQAPGDELNPHMYEVGAGYFETMGIPILRGRAFTEEEGSAEENRAIVINERFAERFWPNENPVGHRIMIGSGKDDPSLEIVGVVGNVRHGALSLEPPLQCYLPYQHSRWMRLMLVVRARAAPQTILSSIRKRIRQADPGLPTAEPQLVADIIEGTTRDRRATMLLLGAFAVLALVLAAVGIYGVIAYHVTQRSREFAIRAALGARPRDVVRLVVAKGLRITAVGLGLGLVLSLLSARLLSSLLYGVAPADPWTHVAIPLILGVTALGACIIPARRATRVDPAFVLRAE